MDSEDCKGFLKHMKKRPDGLSVGKIDNTAPVRKIVDDTLYVNRQAFVFLHSNRLPRYYDEHRTNKHFLNPGHLLAAFPDDWDGDLSLDFYQPFRYKCMQPKMITSIGNNNDKDPIAEFLKIKQKWYDALVCQRYSAFRTKVPLLEYLKEHSDDIISCPKHIVDMAMHWDNDPDPYFNSAYNWYYAGNGNMQLVVIDGKEYLMCSEIHVCNLFEFNRDEVTFKRCSVAAFDCGEGNNICESVCSSQNIIALRTKYKIFILKIVTIGDEIELEQIEVSESKTAYTGISFDECHKNILYVTDLNNTLKIVNIDRLRARTVELKNSVKSLVNNWSTVVSNERMYYTHVSTRAITLYDKRVNNSIRRWSNPDRVSDDAICSLISAAKYSLSGPYLYVATNHNLLLMDMRYQKNLALKPLQRWTHGMQSFPSYISISSFERDKELICLSSQWCEDTCVVPNYLQREWTDPEFKGMTIPYRLPSIVETLKEAKLKPQYTDLYKSVDNRLVTALSGSLLFEDGEKYIVLSQNSLGDVTSHVLYPDHMSTPVDDAPEALIKWCECYDDVKKDFMVTFYRDISPIWKVLEKVPEGELNKKFENETTNFSEQEVLDAFKNEEIEESLLDVWMENEEGESKILDIDSDDKSSLSLSLNITKDVD
ncbi:uncharacterized protein LOC125234128 [Leguminivora glycinivorella]|uniref:uncharacterized protein LOC125234128 n=1 Tax=Leguminivora glycinivorella TaxID=1035111 RepID=UPI00200D686C|nr:uncharacterized protein LOC125234128 [Leguminivora glycinivorella]